MNFKSILDLFPLCLFSVISLISRENIGCWSFWLHYSWIRRESIGIVALDWVYRNSCDVLWYHISKITAAWSRRYNIFVHITQSQFFLYFLLIHYTGRDSSIWMLECWVPCIRFQLRPMKDGVLWEERVEIKAKLRAYNLIKIRLAVILLFLKRYGSFPLNHLQISHSTSSKIGSRIQSGMI